MEPDNEDVRLVGERRVLVGVTGSVATIKVPELVKQLRELQDMTVSVATLGIGVVSSAIVQGVVTRVLINTHTHTHVCTHTHKCA